jgi:transcriptional regulator with XRE-family HTH domain
MTTELAFGHEIKKAREVLRKSQEALAFEAGIHRTYLSLLERGKKSPSLAVIVRLANALRVRPSELLRRVEIAFEQAHSQR